MTLVPSEEGDFSTPLRFGRNDGDGGSVFIICAPLKGKRLTTFCASLRSGGRRLAVRTAMEHPIGALPRTPFPASRDFPSRGNEGHGEKNRRVIYFMYHSGVSPFGALRHHLSAPLGSVSLDSQTSGRIAKGRRLYGQARRQLIRPCVFYAEYAPLAPCESSSLATAVRWGGKRKAP